MTIDDTAEGVIRVANSEMVRALRVITIERGLDPRSFALVAFGGAGPMHACALAEELGISTVVVPEAGGVLSAFGLAASDLRLDDLAAYPRRLADVTPVELDEAFAPLEREAAGVLSGAVLLRRADLRYRGQSFELTIDVGELGSLEERFAAEHERRYGYRIPGEPVELVTLRLVATAAVGVPLGPAPSGAARPAPVTRRPLRTEGRWVDADVFDRSGMGAGSRVTGPAIVSLAGSTCVVAAGWEGAVDAVGSLVLRRGSA
jgi:N-methylhydantoinase A